MSVVASIHTSGQCGFPGRPLNAKVFIESKTSDTPHAANNSTVDSLKKSMRLPGTIKSWIGLCIDAITIS
jgi:hypothetical protein